MGARGVRGVQGVCVRRWFRFVYNEVRVRLVLGLALWAHSIDNCLTRDSIVEVDGAGGRYRKRASATVDVFATSCKLSSEIFSTVLYNEHVIKPKSQFGIDYICFCVCG